MTFCILDFKYLSGEYPFNIAHFSRPRIAKQNFDMLFDGRKERAKREKEAVFKNLEAHFASYEEGYIFSVNRLNEKKSGGIGCSRELALQFIEILLDQKRIVTINDGRKGTFYRKVA